MNPWEDEGPDDEDDRPTTDVTDPATGFPTVLNSKCGTCIFRPGNLKHLSPGRRDSLVREALADGTWIICHSTLPIQPERRERQAVCRGFYDVHRHQSFALTLAERLGGPAFADLEDLTPLPPNPHTHRTREP